MKRILLAFASLALVFSLTASAQAVTTNASCAILMDAESGRVLYAKDIHARRLIASITKLMTALVAVEHTADLDAEVVIQGEWLGSEGSSIYLQAGEKISMRGLLYGLLLESGNDAAVAIACAVSGDVEEFVSLMNLRAAELGMKNTCFANPSGLNDENHYSSAYDMALLACECLENPVVAEICASKSAVVGKRTFYNHNKLLQRYEGCVGMKTGYTELAGRTLVSAATRKGQTLVCVTLNDGNDWNDHAALLDFGFECYPTAELCRQGDVFGAVKIAGSLIPSVTANAAEAVSYPLKEGETLRISIEITNIVQAPVSEGTVVGYAVWTLNGEEVARTELKTDRRVPADLYQRESLWQRFLRSLDKYTLSPMGEHLI